MRILLLTPLFPPDTGSPAPYVKYLAGKLLDHTVTLILYGKLPEHVPNVKTIVLDKRQLKIRLLWQSFRTLQRTGSDHDLIIISNGPSTELPALLYSFFTKTPLTLCISDSLAAQASSHGIYRIIHQALLLRVKKVVTLPKEDSLYLKEEILPFRDANDALVERRNNWWTAHLKDLTTL